MPTITRDELMAIPAPARTQTWNPIPHHEVYDQVDQVFRNMGVEVLNTRIDAHRSGMNVFVTHRLNVGGDSEKSIELGWRNSMNKTFALGFTSGTHIMVCSNLVFTGEWMDFRKHTSGLDTEIVMNMATKGINQVMTQAQTMVAWFDELREIPKNKTEIDLIFMQMLRRGVVPGAKMMDLINAYDEEVKRYGETLYTAYNCATQTFRDLSLPVITKKSTTLNNLIEMEIATPGVYTAAA